MGPGARRGRKRQSGQALVLVALSIVAIITMLGLVLMGGLLYGTRRNLQTLADGAALAATKKVNGMTCDLSQANNAFAAANALIGAEVGAGSGSIAGGCATGYTGTYSYPNSITATFHWPYAGPNGDAPADVTKVEVILLQQVDGLQLSAFLGMSTATVKNRAVAQNQQYGLAGTFALYSRTTIDCQGNSVITANGSIYAHDGFTGNGGCVVYAAAIPNGSGGFADYGNETVTADATSWAHAKADGYQLGGTAAPACGPNQYVSGAQAGNPNPCNPGPGPRVNDVPLPFMPDPNTSPPNPSSGLCSPSGSYPALGPAGGVDINGNPLYGPPGCYSSLSVSGTIALQPGFYYFNGSGVSGGGGSFLTGKDVTLEFANGAGFSFGTCGSACGVGLSNYTFDAPTSASVWCLASASCPDKGLLIYQANSATPGTLNFKGPHGVNYITGTVFWGYGSCTMEANDGGFVNGQVMCNYIHTQTGANKTPMSVTWAGNNVNHPPPRALLVE